MEDFDNMFKRLGVLEDVHKFAETKHGWRPGAAKKVFALNDEYEPKLKMYMLLHPTATRSFLRHELLPPLVRSIFVDWAPLRQEHLVRAGVRIWFNKNVMEMKDPKAAYWAWAGFHKSSRGRSGRASTRHPAA